MADIQQVRVPPGVNPAALSQAPAQEPAQVPTAPQAPQAPEPAPQAPAAAPQAPQFTPEQLAAAAAFLASQQAPATEPEQPQTQQPPAVPEPLAFTGLGDPVLEAQANVFAQSVPGLDVDRVVGLAIERGDPSLIDVKYLQEIAPDKAANLATMAKGIVQTVQSIAERADRIAFEAAGSKENWEAAVALFNSKASDTERKFVNFLLKSADEGNFKQAAAAVVDLAKRSGALKQPAQLLTPGNPAGLASQGLSDADFRKEMAKLDPFSPNFATVLNDLQQRRLLGRQAGL